MVELEVVLVLRVTVWVRKLVVVLVTVLVRGPEATAGTPMTAADEELWTVTIGTPAAEELQSHVDVSVMVLVNGS